MIPSTRLLWYPLPKRALPWLENRDVEQALRWMAQTSSNVISIGEDVLPVPHKIRKRDRRDSFARVMQAYFEKRNEQYHLDRNLLYVQNMAAQLTLLNDYLKEQQWYNRTFVFLRELPELGNISAHNGLNISHVNRIVEILQGLERRDHSS